MINKTQPTLLEQLESIINVDADTMDARFIKTLPITCHDMTSNQKFVHEAITASHNKDIVDATIKDLKGAPWEDVYARCIARFAKRVLPLISGRVLAQTSPADAHDEERTLDNARRYARAFNAEGIPNSRFCIKLATTSAGVRAARTLRAEDIPTLGTALFSVPQAIAASQAGMHAISMYFNEPKAHTDAALWSDVADPAMEHTSAARHVQIRQIYNRLARETGQRQPQIKTASFVSIREILAMPELGADHVTLGLQPLTDLMSYNALPAFQKGTWKLAMSDFPGIDSSDTVWESWTPPQSTGQERIGKIALGDPLHSGGKAWQLAGTDVDYLAEGVLDGINEEDEATRLRLAEGLRRFALMEDASKEYIQALQNAA